MPTGKAAAGLGDLTDAGVGGHRRDHQAGQGLREGRGTVGKLMTDEQLYDELTAVRDHGRAT